jgi:hypothetical protein
MKPSNKKTLPSREIAYNYCVAMFMAQQLEDGLRYILDSADYYGLVEEIELSKREKEKYRDSVAELLDQATCGHLKHLLKKRIALPSEEYWKTLQSAIDDRNFLAHKFLVQFDYEALTKKDEEKIIRIIHEQFLRLWKGVQVVRALKKSLDEKTDRIDLSLEELIGSKQSRKKTRQGK